MCACAAVTATLPGISAPFDSPYFDPAGLSVNAKPADIKRWREAELTHGRVAMLAALGFIVGEQLEDFPAFMNVDGNIVGACPACSVLLVLCVTNRIHVDRSSRSPQ